VEDQIEYQFVFKTGKEASHKGWLVVSNLLCDGFNFEWAAQVGFRGVEGTYLAGDTVRFSLPEDRMRMARAVRQHFSGDHPDVSLENDIDLALIGIANRFTSHFYGLDDDLDDAKVDASTTSTVKTNQRRLFLVKGPSKTQQGN